MNPEIIKLRHAHVLSQLRTVIHWNFSDSTNYSEMPNVEYHRKVEQAQDHINAQGLGAIIAWDIREEIASYCGNSHVMIANGVYLRAARPGLANDVVGWHRESMYGAPRDAINLWMPVANCTIDNTLQYFPGTDTVADADIETVQENSAEVARGSAGSKIGLLYAPKRITRWHSYDTVAPVALPMIVPDGSVALFPGQLIHGAAVNRTNKIRFSVDVRLLARENVQ